MTTFYEPDVRKYFRLLQLGDPETVIELRAFRFGGRKVNTYSGYFNRETPFVHAAKIASERSGGAYVTVNPCNPQLLCRAANRAVEFAELATSDKDIARRRWIPVDCDPIRPSGCSSSHEQHDAAIDKSEEIYKWLCDSGSPKPVRVDSGNGAHLMLPIDEPNTDESRAFVSRLLEDLSERFSDEVVKVDTTCSNAARVLRIAGTMNRKGDNLPKYPHRLCRILSIPESLKTIATTSLEQQGSHE